ncbi:MAG: hypothetical protein H7338_15930 [Candidatus Sericytochromatia bacterium]|nr:hypothetical protein [Candidatus Sericytochromatia bacterium]
MHYLLVGHGAAAIELLGVQALSEAPSLPAAVLLDRDALLTHPLVYRDKVFFQAERQDYVGYVANISAFQPIMATVTHEGREVPVLSPYAAVQWQHEGKHEPVTVSMVMGLKQQHNAPDTFAERPPPKPPGQDPHQLLAIAGTFAAMIGFSLSLAQWASPRAAIAGATGLISGGLTAMALQARHQRRIDAPDITAPADQPFWEVVRSLANRQIHTSALPGEWTVAAIPQGVRRSRDWSWVVGGAVGIIVLELLLRWPPT